MSQETDKKSDSPQAGAVTQILSTNSDGLHGASVQKQTSGFTQRETGDAEL